MVKVERTPTPPASLVIEKKKAISRQWNIDIAQMPDFIDMNPR